MASPNVSFDSIPSSIRKPGVYAEFNTKLAVRTLPSNAYRLIIIGLRNYGQGSVSSGQKVAVFSDAQAGQYFGYGSQIHGMVAAAIKANRYAQISAIGIDEPVGSTAATGFIDLVGGAATGGSVELRIAGRSIEISLTTETPSQIVAALVARVNAMQDLPVTAQVQSNPNNDPRIFFTAKFKGTAGNDISIDFVRKTGGFNWLFQAMNSGGGDPDISALLASIFSATEEILVFPNTTVSLYNAVKAHLTARSDAIEQRGAIGVFGTRLSLANATSIAAGMNSGRMTIAALPASPTPGYEIAAAYAAVIAAEEDPARPLNGLALSSVAPCTLASRLSRTEQEVCLANGVTPLVVGPGETVQIVRAITTYTTSPENGASDISLLDLTTMRTLDYCRKAWRERIQLRFPREKRTPEIRRQVRSELLDVAYKLEGLGIIENVDDHKDGFVVEDDSQDPNRLNVRLPTDVVNGLHVVAARIDLLL